MYNSHTKVPTMFLQPCSRDEQERLGAFVVSFVLYGLFCCFDSFVILEGCSTSRHRADAVFTTELRSAIYNLIDHSRHVKLHTVKTIAMFYGMKKRASRYHERASLSRWLGFTFFEELKLTKMIFSLNGRLELARDRKSISHLRSSRSRGTSDFLSSIITKKAMKKKM